MKFLSKIVLILFFIYSGFSAQTFLNKNDSLILIKRFEFANKIDLRKSPTELAFLEIAKSFIGSDYSANTLDSISEKHLATTLSGFDCYTLIENSLALALTIKNENPTENLFFENLKLIRYRNGNLIDYSSRLHYFSDWIWDLSKRKIIKDITKGIGGNEYFNEVNFMSHHPQYYKYLNSDSLMIQRLSEVEKQISSREYFYIPHDEIEKFEDKINPGDIIGITTNIVGLDISHTGIAIRIKNRLHFLHSPNVGKKVEITSIPLSDYIKAHKSQTGIIVARIN